MPAVLQLDGVSFSAGGRKILSGVNLAFGPGRLSAIIGPSGCGKTTLLKCLTSLCRPSAGTVRLGDKDLWEERRRFRRLLGYVPQDDIIHQQLTVDQAFRYSARLRLDDTMTEQALETRIAAVAKLLGLEERRKLRIYRLSGGQRKRVNIGIELLADPQMLVLDEPASGLDPGTEEDLVKLLGILARQGRTVVMTTHSMEYLAAVGRIVLMADGRVVFAGDHAELLAHFGVPHAAEVFKALRRDGVDSWESRYRNSALAARAARP